MVRRATVKDVAVRAGVSPSTVSNVLNDYPFIADETRSRVLAAIEAIGYRPCAVGRILRSGRSNTIALAIPDLRSPYCAELAHAMVIEAARRGLVLLVDETGGSPERELRAAEGYDGASVSGVLLFTMGAGEEQLSAAARDVPLVVLGSPVRQPWTDHLSLDSDGSAEALVAHLAAQGCVRFAYLGRGTREPGSSAAAHVRSLRTALRARGLDLDGSAMIGLDALGHADGADGARRLLTAGVEVDALLTANGPVAAGAVRTLRRAGVDVPGRVAVAAWGGSPECEYSDPSLTAVDQDHDAVARLAFDLIARRCEDPRTAPTEHLLGWCLSVRESSGRPSAGWGAAIDPAAAVA